jgi:hypothetical protein
LRNQGFRSSEFFTVSEANWFVPEKLKQPKKPPKLNLYINQKDNQTRPAKHLVEAIFDSLHAPQSIKSALFIALTGTKPSKTKKCKRAKPGAKASPQSKPHVLLRHI